MLVGLAEPVPAFLHVRRAGLAGIGHEAGVLLGRQVHPRAGGEVVGRLGAAVQHDDQRHRLPMVAAGHVELVGAAAGRVAEALGQELRAVRQARRRCARGKRLGCAARHREAALADPVEQAAQRLGDRQPDAFRLVRHRFAVAVDGRRAAPGRAGRRLPRQRALQGRRGFGQAPGLGETRRLDQALGQEWLHRVDFPAWDPVRHPRSEPGSASVESAGGIGGREATVCGRPAPPSPRRWRAARPAP